MTAHLEEHTHQLLQCIEEAVSAEGKDTRRILSYLNECDQLGIDVLPPDINQSDMECVLESETALRLGFSALLPAGSHCLTNILEERRKHGVFKSFQDFCERIDVETFPEGLLTRSIEAGLFDSTSVSRARLLAGYSKILNAVQKSKTEQAANQISLFDMIPAASQAKAAPVTLPDADPWTDDERIDHETRAVGFSYTAYLLQRDEDDTEEEVTADDETGDVPDHRQPARPVCQQAVGEPTEQVVEESETPEEKTPDMSDEPASTPSSELGADVEEQIGEVETVEEQPPPPEEEMYVESEREAPGITEPPPPREETAENVSEPSENAAETPEHEAVSQLTIRLDADRTTEQALYQLRDRLEQARGTVPVILEFVDGDRTVGSVKVHADYQVSVSDEVVKDLETLAGEQTVRLEYTANSKY